MDLDDRLMERYRRGDVRAFEELYERWEGRVYGFCLRYLGDRDLAADAFQETFRRLVESRERYEPRGRFGAWLFTLARRSCVDRLRERPGEAALEAARRPPRGRPDRGAPGRPGGRAARAGPPASDLEEAVVRRSELARLLRRLPPRQREALLLAKYHGFTYAEIGEMVGASEAAVKQRVYRALRTLRGEP